MALIFYLETAALVIDALLSFRLSFTCAFSKAFNKGFGLSLFFYKRKGGDNFF